MHVALLTAQEELAFSDLTSAFDREGIPWAIVSETADSDDLTQGPHDLLIIDMTGERTRAPDVEKITAECHKDVYVPVLGLVAPGQLREIDASLGLDDFVLTATDTAEVITRLAVLHGRFRVRAASKDEIKLGDLRINLARYEVWVEMRQVTLTYKEYELLRILASRPGHVFTRNTLLDVVWGYDYFGGTRTVDVHVRRLRSKIEDSSHTFVETVRNVGYRLRSHPDSH